MTGLPAPLNENIMTLCGLCNTIPFFDLPEFPSWISQHIPADIHLLSVYLLRGKENKELKALGVKHHNSLTALTTAAKTCEICRIIESGVQKTIANYKDLIAQGGGKYLSPIGEPTCDLWICARRQHSKGQGGFMVLSTAAESNQVYAVMGAGYCVKDDSPLALHYPGRPVDPDPLSEATLGRLREWLRQCEEEHDHPRRVSTPLPSRVLDVADPRLDVDHVRIVDAPGQAGRYATLSHCWGTQSRPSVLLRADLDRMKRGVRVSEMSVNFQHAVRVTRALGLRYLWIDGLCIFQDNQRDWERESAQMATVFDNAFVTLSAIRSPDHAAGFCTLRPERRYATLSRTINGIEGTILVFEMSLYKANSGHSIVEMSKEPLTDRGWALQERWLSRCLLHFSSEQIYFECRSHFLTEDGYSHPEKLYHLGKEDVDNRQPVSTISSQDLQSWHNVIRAYSNRKLTKPSDKLPALAGLAAVFANRLTISSTEDRKISPYLAGLWRDNLIKDLAWQCPGETVRAAIYRAPTWSWISLDKKIVAQQAYERFTELATLEDAHVHVPGLNPYGEVTSAWLRLKTLVLPCKVTATYRDAFPEIPQLHISYAGHESVSWFVSDVPQEGKRSHLLDNAIDLKAVVLMYELDGDSPTGHDIVFCLVVKPAERDYVRSGGDNGQTFQRVGFAFFGGRELVTEMVTRKDEEGVAGVITLV